MLEGEIVSLQPVTAPVALSPLNNQLQVSSITLRLPEMASASSRAGTRKRGRMNEVVILTHAIVGNGSFGIVYRASCHRFKSLALKVCHGKPARLQKEWAALSRCAAGSSEGARESAGRALCIPEVYFAAWSNQDPNLLIIGMELCMPLTLHDFLMDANRMMPSVSAYLAQEVAEAVAFVHRCRCIHRDVKLQNFVFSLDGRLKLIDFGIATDTLEPPPGDVTAGTIAFMSPEMASNVLSAKADRVVVGAPADVWSVGAVLFCIFTQADLYTDEEEPMTPGGDVNTRLLHRVARAEWRWPSTGHHVPLAFKSVIESCMQLEPAARPTMEGVLEAACWSRERLTLPQAVSSFLSVDTLGVDEKGAVCVEGASVRRSPLGARPHATPRHQVPSGTEGGCSISSLVNDLLSPLDALGRETQISLNSMPVSRALLTDVASPPQSKAPPFVPSITPAHSQAHVTSVVMTPSAYTSDDTILGLLSPLGVGVAHQAPDVSDAIQTSNTLRHSFPTALLKQKLPKASSHQISESELYMREVIIAEREQDMADLASLFNCQSVNFKHPHRFKFHEKPQNKSYAGGYMCDVCGVFYAPKRGYMAYFHCSCGSDLCEKCHSEFTIECTCSTCGMILENPQSLQRHSTRCEQRARSRGSASLARKRERSASMGVPSSGGERITLDTTIRQLPRASKSASRSRGVPSTAALGAHGGYNLPTVPAPPSSEPLVTEPVTLNPVSPNAPHQWLPFENFKKMAAAEVATADALLPTEAERALLVGDAGDWVRYFHYYPEGASADALVYSVQPGRCGGIFLSNTSPIHSCVLALVESTVCVVDYVDTSTGHDRVRVISLEEGKIQQPTSVEILLHVMQRDTNLFKQRRGVGTMSQYTRPQHALDSMGAQFVYARWVRRDSANKIDVFCLSNGCFQVFIQDMYEIRWAQGGRKFRVRPNGACELVDEEIFASIPALVALTHPIL